MGFKVPKNTVTLKFESDEYDGLEIVAKMGTVRDGIEGENLQKKAEGLPQSEQVNMLFQYLMKFIISWNLEDEDGNPVPINSHSLLDFPAGFAWDIFNAFFVGTVGVDAELGKDSDSTSEFQAELIPMETLSTDQTN